MADMPNTEEIIGGLPEEHREAVTGLVGGLTEKFEGDITNLKSSHDTAFNELKTRFDNLEMENAGLKDKQNGNGGIGDNDLSDSQKALKSRREQEQAEAKRQEEMNALKARNEALETAAFERAKKDAKAGGIPDEVINLSKDSEDLERSISMYKALNKNGNPGGGSNLGSTRDDPNPDSNQFGDGADAMGAIIDNSNARRNARS